MYDPDTGALLNDEYLSSLYTNSDKISHLLNINSKLSDPTPHSNLSPSRVQDDQSDGENSQDGTYHP
jgi:hypothetical protein